MNVEEGHLFRPRNNQTCAGATQLRGSSCGCKGWHMMIENPYISGVWLALKLSAVPIRIWQTKAGGGSLCTCVFVMTAGRVCTV